MIKDYLGLSVPRAIIESKEKGRTPTCWVVLRYPVSDAEFLTRADDALNPEGWSRDEYGPPPSPLDGVAEVVFASHGTGLFRGWRRGEYRVKMAGLNNALSALGLPVYRKRLTLADMM